MSTDFDLPSAMGSLRNKYLLIVSSSTFMATYLFTGSKFNLLSGMFVTATSSTPCFVDENCSVVSMNVVIFQEQSIRYIISQPSLNQTDYIKIVLTTYQFAKLILPLNSIKFPTLKVITLKIRLASQTESEVCTTTHNSIYCSRVRRFLILSSFASLFRF